MANRKECVNSQYSTSILGEVQTRGLSPLFTRLDSTSLESDRLAGGSGNDSLLGGSGNDYFVYDTNAAFTATAVGLDTLFDFSANDFIVLDKTTFTRLASTAGTGFNISSDFGFANDLAAIASSTARIVYNPTDGGLFYNENGGESGLGSGQKC